MTIHIATSPVLNEDILFYVLKNELSDHALASAALVCRAWTQPAQGALYRNICFSTMDNNLRDQLLARTMRTCPHLGRHIRRLQLFTLWTHAPTPGLIDWVRLLPAHGMREFHWRWHRGQILPVLFEYAAVRAVSRLTLHGRLYSASRLQPLLELPLLQSLSLELSGHETGDLYPPEASKLEHLGIRLSSCYGPIVDKLLAVTGPRIISFRLSSEMKQEPEEEMRLASAIWAYLPNIIRLDIETPPTLHRPMPFLDGLLCRYGALEHLRCTVDRCCGKMFQDLPPTLRTLELSYTGRRASFSHEAFLIEFLQGRGRNLRMLTFVTSDPQERFPQIATACECLGIDFHVSLGAL